MALVAGVVAGVVVGVVMVVGDEVEQVYVDAGHRGSEIAVPCCRYVKAV